MSQRVYHKIWQSIVNAGNCYEVGGLLIGHKVLNIYFVVAVTVPDMITDKSITSFILEGNDHIQQALEIIRRFHRKPSILGAWHSHICDGLIFSGQDQQANKQLAKSLNGAISMITMMDIENQKVNCVAYSITANGKEYPCRTKVDYYGRKIPNYFLI